jgi:glycosyltransferase involved in cell wall biosynthesis
LLLGGLRLRHLQAVARRSTISVVTAVHRPSLPHLAAAHSSLTEQHLPAGWAWEWIVQQDGAPLDLPAVVTGDPRVSIGRNAKLGPAGTRNAALARSTGELVKVLDADDMLAPGALARDVAALQVDGVEWATAKVVDLLPDGSTVEFGSDPDHGVLPRWSVVDHWRANGHRLPVHPATLCIRRGLIEALGGWMELPTSEDTGLMLSANAVADGFFTATAGLYYRKGDHQITATAAHNDPGNRDMRVRAIERRLRDLEGGPPDARPLP